MKNSVKRVTKKALSFLLAVAMMFSVLSVAMTALANEVEIVYTVTEAKPAIPAKQGKVIDLRKIAVEIGNDTYRASDLDWSTDDTTGGVAVGNGVIAMLGSDIYALEAVVPNTGEKQTVYVMQTDDSGVATIYDHTFTSADLASSTQFTEASEWVAYDGLNLTATSNGIAAIHSGSSKNAFFYLNPNSASGKRVIAFPEITLDMKIRGFNGGNTGAWVGAILRLNVGETGITDAATSYVSPRFITRAAGSTNGMLRYYYPNTTVSGTTSTYTTVLSSGNPLVPGTNFDLRFIIGADNKISSYEDADLETEGYEAAKENYAPSANVASKGTIGVFAELGIRPYFNQVTVTTTLDISRMEEYFTNDEIYVVKAGKPALAMYAGQKLDLSKLFFEFDNGTVAGGSQIAWDTKDATGGIEVSNTAKTITVLKDGFYEVTAAYTKAGEAKTFYVITPDADNTKTIIDYTFKSTDVGTVTSDGYHAFGGANGDLWKFYAPANTSVSWSAGGVANGGGSANGVSASVNLGINITSVTGHLVLNPESAEGKVMADFADYTIVYRATLHPNFVTYNNKTVPVMGRYVMATAGEPNYATDSYLGYNAPWSNSVNGGLLYSKNITHSGSTATNSNYTIVNNVVTEGDLDFKMHYAGEEFIFSVKGADSDDSAYTTLYTMSEDANAPAAAKATASQAGTFAVYTNSNTRVTSQYFKVTLDFTTDEINAIAARSTYIDVISAQKSAIPMQQGKKLNLKELYVEFDDGSVKNAKDITWSTEDTTGGLLVDDEAKTISLLGSGVYALTAKCGDAEQTIYVFEPDSDNTKVLYEHTFSAADVDTTNKTFVADSEWTLLAGAGNLVWNSLGGVQTGNATSSTYALKPTSEGGKKVSSFRDVIIETNMAFPIKFNNANSNYAFTLVGRSNWADNSAISGAPATYVGGGYNGANYLGYDWVTSTVSGKTNSHTFSTYDTAENTFYNFKVELIGSEVKLYKKGTQAPLTMTAEQTAAIADTKAGSIYLSNTNTRMIIKDIKVTAVLSAEDIATISKYYIGDEFLIAADNAIIPITVGDKVDLTTAYIEFNNGVVKSAKDLTFDTDDTTGGVLVSNIEKSVALLGRKVYAVTAAYDDEVKTIYVTEPDADNTALIYEHTFSVNDISDGTFIDSSEWTLLSGSSTTLAENAATGGITADNATAYYALKPTSESAKKIASFRDVVMEASLGFTTLYGAYGDNFIMGVRANWADNANPGNTPATYVGGGYRTCLDGTTAQSNKDYAVTYVSGKSSKVEFSESYTTADNLRTYKISAIGDTFALYRNGVASGAEVTSAQTEAIKNTEAGNIWFKATGSNRLILKSVKVYAVVSQATIDLVDKYSTSLVLVKADAPALPLYEGKNIDVSDIFFEFDSGTIVSGESIVWESASTAVSVDNAANTILLKKNRLTEVIATYPGETDKSFYLVQPDGNNQVELMDYTFSASDAGLAATDAAGNAIWKASGNTSWSWLTKTYATQVAGDNGVVNQGLRNDSGTNLIYLNPESEQGKLVSGFSDYILEFTGSMHENWVDDNLGYPILARYNMADTAAGYSLANDSYIGAYAYFSATNVGGVYVGGTIHAGNAVPYADYTTDYPNMNFRMELSGKDLVFSAKSTNATEYTTLYTMSSDSSAPAAALATAGKTGTIAIYSYSSVRPNLQNIKVTINVDDALIEYSDENAKDFDYISADMPTLPMQAGTKLNLASLYFEFDNGTIVKGSSISWTTDATSGIYLNNNDKSISMFTAPEATKPYVLTASANGVEAKQFFAFVPDANNEYVIYDKTFKEEDFEVHADYVDDYDKAVEYKFNDASEWIADVAASGDRTGNVQWSTTLNGVAPLLSDYSAATDADGNPIYDDYGLPILNRSAYYIGDKVSGSMYLNPNSANGKLVSQFKNVAVDFTVKPATAYGNTSCGVAGPIARFQVNEAFKDEANLWIADDNFDSIYSGNYYKTEEVDGFFWFTYDEEGNLIPLTVSQAVSRVESLWRIKGTDSTVIPASKTAIKLGINANYAKYKRTDGVTTDAVQQDFVFNVTDTVQRLEVIGDTVNAYIKDAGAATFNKAEFTMTDAMSSAVKNTTAGTIGFHWGETTRLAVKSAKVSVVVTEDEKAFIEDNSSALNLTSVIPANKPALPATVDNMIKLSNFYVEFNNGAIVPASEITWESVDKLAAFVDNGSKTVTMLKAGTATIKATYAGQEKLIYLVTLGANNEYVLYNHKFSANDLIGAAFKEDSEWATNVSNLAIVHGALGLDVINHNAASDGAFWIKPTSASGVMISAFDDITVEYVSKALGGEGFAGPLLRLDFGDNKTYDNTDTGIYPAVVARSSTSTGQSFVRMYINGSETIGGGSSTALTVEGTTTDMKYLSGAYADSTGKNVQFTHRATVKGTQLTLQYTSNDTMNKEVLVSNVMAFDNTTATAKGGTVGFRGLDVRNAQALSYKVIIDFSDEFVALVAGNTQKVNLIGKDKPAIPMSIGQTLYLSLVTLTDDSGNLIDGSKATWTISDENVYVVYDEESNSLTSFSSGYATLTATYEGNSADVYLSVANADGEYVIYEHKFSRSDLIETDYTSPIGNKYYVFTEASEWYAKNGTSNGRPDYTVGLGYGTFRSDGMQHRYLSASGEDTMGRYYKTEGDTSSGQSELPVTIFLRPDSASGIKVSSFADVSVDVKYTSNGNNDVTPGIYLRAEITGNATDGYAHGSSVRALYYQRNNASSYGTWLRIYNTSSQISEIKGSYGIIYDINGNVVPKAYVDKVDEEGNPVYDDNGKVIKVPQTDENGEVIPLEAYKGIFLSDGTRHKVGNFRDVWATYEIAGANTLRATYATNAEYSDAVTISTDSTGVNIIEKATGVTTASPSGNAINLTKTTGGTIAFYQPGVNPVGYDNVRVRISFTADEMTYLARFVDEYAESKVVEYEDISQYRNGAQSIAPQAPYNKAFAGWYKDEDCTIAVKDGDGYTGKAYAKFVNDDVFSVKWQITNPADTSGKVDLRLVTTVDSLRYQKIAFEIIRENGTKRQRAIIETTEVFEKIVGNEEELVAYDPTVFADSSKFFATGRVTGTDWATWGDGTYYVTVMLQTLDGTIVRNDEEVHRFKMNYDDKAIDIAEEELKNQIATLGDTVKNNTTGNKIYISEKTGNDATGSGTEAAPFATYAKAYAAAADGDTILFERGGTYRMAYLQTQNSVSIGAYGTGAKPLILGSTDIKSTLTKIDSFTLAQDGLNPDEFTAPEGTTLWTVQDVSLATDSDIGALFFVETGDKVTVADKKWNRKTDHKLYNEELDALDAPYDFFYDYNNKDIYVLLPAGKTPADYEAVEALGLENVFIVNANNVTIENLEIRYGNFGVVVYDVDGTTLRGLEIGWIGGNRQSNLGDYTLTGGISDYVRLGNGIENWGGGTNLTIDQCYVYECYDAGITFQNNTQKQDREGRPNYTDSQFENIKFTNNLLTRNIYNIEYFQSHDNGKDDTYIKNVLFEGNICRDAGGTEENPMWASLYRPDKGVAANIKGSTTGNNTMLTDNPNAWLEGGSANYSLTAQDGYVSSFQIKNNIFDGSYDRGVMNFSAANEGGAPIFEGNLVVGGGDQTVTVNRKSYSIKNFVSKFDSEKGGSVINTASSASAIFASARTLSAWGAVEEDTLANTLYKLQSGEINVGYIGGSVTNGMGASNPAETSYRALVSKWLSDTYGANVHATNAAIGGTSSHLGFYRIDQDLLSEGKQDLVFIEFAINDVYAGVSEMDSHLYMEGMIKKIRQQNPYADIVILLITNNSNDAMMQGDYANLKAHQKVAEHYGIPAINIAEAVYNAIQAGTYTWEDLYKNTNSKGEEIVDAVHPNDTGYEFFKKVITEALAEKLGSATASYTEHIMPQVDLVSNSSGLSTIVTAENITTLDGFELMDYYQSTGEDDPNKHMDMSEAGRNSGRFKKAIVGGEGDSFEYTFTGKDLSLWYSNMTNAGGTVELRITVDGSAIYQTVNRAAQCEWKICDNLYNGRHTVKVEVLSGNDIAVCGLMISK